MTMRGEAAMALCSTCRTVIPCHCHVTPPVEVRPGVYLARGPYPAEPTSRGDEK
ncbi:hypothetical protein [Streptomyces sp. NPDC052701]|uniref:hypothetical protein n=1 Tax=Streptomyces sp. NPDC052701 TaxID=3155533 RepID=UPI00342E894A